MLFGSVPRPPKKPKSWTSTQVARQSTTVAATAGNRTRRQAVTMASPIAASAITTNRFTANPCASSNAVNALIQPTMADGWFVWAIDWVMAASEPG